MASQPREPLADEVLEADELYQNAGKKSDPHRDPFDPPRRRAHERRGHGTNENDRPPIFSVKGRASGEVRSFVRHHSESETCLEVVRVAAKPTAQILNTDAWQGAAKVEVETGLQQATVRHGKGGSEQHEWAREEGGDGGREVHCKGCDGAGAALRTYLRVLCGVRKKRLDRYVATFEVMTNAKRFTPPIFQRMCLLQQASQSDDT